MYVVLDKWFMLCKIKVDFEEIYLSFLIFVDEMKGLLIWKELEDILNLVLFKVSGFINMEFFFYVFEIK